MFHGTHISTIDNGARMSATHAKADARSAKSEVEFLSNDVERLLMITEALWGILKQDHGYDDDELARRVMDIDMRDGQLDGKVAATGGATCPQCSRTTNRKRIKCLYCGTILPSDPFAR